MKKSYLKYLAALLLFGSNGFVASLISLTSYETVLTRSVLGSALLITLYILTGHNLSFVKHKKDLAFVALSGIAMAADWLLLFESYTQIGVSLSVLINYFGPAIVIALSPIVLKEKIKAQKLIALIIAIVGVILVSGSAVIDGLNTHGIICAVLSAFSYAIMVLSNKKAEQITGMDNSMFQLFVAMITVIIFVGVKQGLSIPIQTNEIIPILWLGLVNTGIGCYLYFSSIGHISAQSVGILGYLEPLSGVLFAAVLLGETMTVYQIVGAFLIIGGAAFGECFRTKKQNTLLAGKK